MSRSDKGSPVTSSSLSKLTSLVCNACVLLVPQHNQWSVWVSCCGQRLQIMPAVNSCELKNDSRGQGAQLLHHSVRPSLRDTVITGDTFTTGLYFPHQINCSQQSMMPRADDRAATGQHCWNTSLSGSPAPSLIATPMSTKSPATIRICGCATQLSSLALKQCTVTSTTCHTLTITVCVSSCPIKSDLQQIYVPQCRIRPASDATRVLLKVQQQQ